MLEQKLITSFDTVKQLDEFVASLLIEELQKPGLVLLPVGNTFVGASERSQGIYPLVNDYFAETDNRLYGSNENQEIYKQQQHHVHPELKLSHLDELAGSQSSFASQLETQLSNVVKQCSSFYRIDTEDISGFEKYIRMAGGPRLIVLGLGADPNTAHVAFMGEEYINSSIERIKLTDALAAIHGTDSAITIGTDLFRMASVESIIVVAKGRSKAKSLAAAFEDPDTGLGYLIAHCAGTLQIYTDQDAVFELKQ